MNTTRRICTLASLAALSTLSCQAATLVGHWTFDNGSLADSTGNFGDLRLQGNASIINGALDVNGSAVSASGWASTPGGAGSPFNAGAGGGVALSSKTLVSWITVESLSPIARAGSAMTLDSVTADNFDGIVFAEKNTNNWMSGSNNWFRSPDGQFSQTAVSTETTTGSVIQLAITYQVSGSTVTVTGYRDGALMGTYSSGNAASWAAGDQEIIFGVRHIGPPLPGPGYGLNGALDALIHEARLYDGALTQGEISALTMVPEPSAALLSLAAAGLLLRRRRQ
jgi:hypothetical protein